MRRMIAVAAVLLVALSGCGGGGRPSQDEIADSIKDDSEFSDVLEGGDEEIDCLAETLHESDLSDEALQAIVDGDEDYEPSKEDEAALTEVFTDGMTACLAG